ncbi:MAG: CBS domain-containing protein [Planctomycetaceae bacterium]|nr:CBS domain-containing protein [Planctomycetaceae bacterium]
MNSYRNITARDVMITKVITLRPHVDAMDAIKIMLKHKIAGIPVVDNKGHYLGVFTEKNSLSLLIGIEYESNPTTEISQFVDTNAATIDEDTDLLTIVNIFLKKHYRRLPVLRDSKELVGLVCRRDVLRAFHRGVKKQNAPSESGVLFLSGLLEREESTVLSKQ